MMIQPIYLSRFTVLAITGLMLISMPTHSANNPHSTSSKILGNTTVEKVRSHAINLRYKDTQLLAAMTDVSRRSKVSIVISPALKDEKISTKVKSADWNNAIKTLLVDFNHIAVVDHQGYFKKIWITGRE